MTDTPDKFTFSHPYLLINNGTGIFTLKAHGMVVASYDVKSWGCEQACIEAAWQHAYGPDENDVLAAALARAERAEAILDSTREHLSETLARLNKSDADWSAAITDAADERAKRERAEAFAAHCNEVVDAAVSERTEELRNERDRFSDKVDELQALLKEAGDILDLGVELVNQDDLTDSAGWDAFDAQARAILAKLEAHHE